MVVLSIRYEIYGLSPPGIRLLARVSEANISTGSVELLSSEVREISVSTVDVECIGLGKVALTSNRLFIAQIRIQRFRLRRWLRFWYCMKPRGWSSKSESVSMPRLSLVSRLEKCTPRVG